MVTTLRAVAGLGPGTPDLGSLEPLGRCLSRWALDRPDVVAYTFLDHLCGPEPVRRSYTWSELDRWSRATAAALSQMAAPGERVAVLAPSGPEYVVGFVAALRAGLVAVPLFPPDTIGHGDRLDLVLADCAPAALVTTAAKHDAVVAYLAENRLGVPAILCPDDLEGPAGESLAQTFADADVDLDDLAYLQYTSGSTRAPAGVELTHRNLAANAHQILAAVDLGAEPLTCVSWLPLFHDMGLMLGAAGGIVVGCPAVVMDPISFVLQPARWLRELGSHRNTVTAAPNFAYDLAARRVSDADLEGVDFGQVVSMLNGAEPVQPATVRRFVERFAQLGLAPGAHCPSYGLAEAVVGVTMTDRGQPPTFLAVEVEALQAGHLVPAEDAGDGRVVRLVASGRPIGQRLAIVDPDTCRLRGEGEVGEIWVHGPNVGRGYWGSPESSGSTFGGELADADAAGAGVPAGPWLRTGDLGALRDGNLFVTGRIKDVIIIDGRNLYPHDIELAVAEAHEAIALNRLAAFAVNRPEGEAVVVVAEQYRKATDVASRLDEIERAARDAVSTRQGLALADFVLVETDSVPRTSSGKIARRSTRDAYLAGALRPVARQEA